MKSELFLKLLKAAAMVSVIVACLVYVVSHLTDGSGSIKQPAAPEMPIAVDSPEHGDLIKVKEPASDPMIPKYEPINEPAALQNMRKEGKTYISRVTGKIEGSAYRKDWGVTGTTNFLYVYGIESTAKITRNDGITIVEERTFNRVIEKVMVGPATVGLDLPAKELSMVFALLSVSPQLRGAAIAMDTGVRMVNGTKVKVPDALLSWLQEKAVLPKQIDPNELEKKMKMFTQEEGENMLVNKTVRITFTDGQGVTNIESLDGSQLSEKEKDMIKRANYVMDHYVMPDRRVAVDEEWSINADVFSGLVDPRMSGRMEGTINMRRTPDYNHSRKLKIEKGNIKFVSTKGTQKVNGAMTGITGTCLIPYENEVVTSATLSGHVNYSEVSTDHLLFEAKMSSTPKFEITYECEVK